MRDSSQPLPGRANTLSDTDEPAWSLPGGVIGFAAWLLALGFPFLIYGSNALFFFLYTWPFFLALMPVAVVVGVALYSLLDHRLLLSTIATLLGVGLLFGILFLWLMS